MEPIYISDPAWQTTFPHLVAPLDDEWLAGLLLRCDEVNGWDSGETVSSLLRATHTKTELKTLSLVLPLSPTFQDGLQFLRMRFLHLPIGQNLPDSMKRLIHMFSY